MDNKLNQLRERILYEILPQIENNYYVGSKVVVSSNNEIKVIPSTDEYNEDYISIIKVNKFYSDDCITNIDSIKEYIEEDKLSKIAKREILQACNGVLGTKYRSLIVLLSNNEDLDTSHILKEHCKDVYEQIISSTKDWNISLVGSWLEDILSEKYDRLEEFITIPL